MPKKILLIDGHALVYRSFYAFINNPLRTSDGKNISGVYGFFNTLFSLITSYKPDGVGVAFDSPWPTHRHKVYPEYKAKREAAPEELHEQIPQIDEILQAMGIPIFREQGQEADDLLGSLAKSQRSKGNRVLIYTGDKDLLQLVEDGVSILRPGFKGALRLYDADTVYEVLGVRPDQVIDYLAMMGDTSDNVPGIPGVGKKTAAKYLEQFDTLENLYAHRESLTPKKREQLENGWELGLLSKNLVSLVLDLSVEEDFSTPVDYGAGLPYFEALQSRSLIKQVKRVGAIDGEGISLGGSTGTAGVAEESGSSTSTRVAGTDGGPIQKAATSKQDTKQDAPASNSTVKPFQPEKGVWVESIEELSRVVDELSSKPWILIDFLVDGENPMTADIVGFSLASDSCPGLFAPIHSDNPMELSLFTEGGEQSVEGTTLEEQGLSLKEVQPLLSKLLSHSGISLVGHNLSLQLKICKRLGVDAPKLQFDTTVAAWILGGVDQYAIEDLVEYYLHYMDGPTYKEIRKKAPLRECPIGDIADYMAIRSGGGVELYKLFSQKLRTSGMEAIFFDLEMPIVSILGEMEYRGIYLDPVILGEETSRLREELESIQAEIYRLCGKEFNLNSTKQLQEVLFEDRGLKPLKKTKTGYSTDTTVLEALALEDPVAHYMVRYRVISKLLSTYLEALPELRVPETGRIHTTFVQTGTVTGRLSSRNPNLQNIPIRTEEGRGVRKGFVAGKGNLLISADYAQIELALLAHLSKDTTLQQSFQQGVDIHAATGGLIFGLPPEKVSPEQRRIAKTINFGVMYGMSPFRLSRELGIPMSDAKTFITAYFAQYAGVREFFETTLGEVMDSGFVETLRGRHRSIMGLDSTNNNQRSAAERIAINTRIQGSAADVVKEAMIQLDRWIQDGANRPQMLLQVHDELLFEAPEKLAHKHAEQIKKIMEDAVSLSVPLRVSVEVGKSWGEFH